MAQRFVERVARGVAWIGGVVPLLMLALSAHAAEGPVTFPEFRRMVVDMAPVVAEAAGRPFLRLPDPSIASMARAAELLSVPPPSLDPAQTSGNGRVTTPADLEGTLALYTPANEGILFLTEAFELFEHRYQLDGDELRELVRCALAHELTHALQHQHGAHDILLGLDEATRQDAMAGREVLVEGHASLVSRSICRTMASPKVARLSEDLVGVGHQAQVPASSTAAPYAWGLLVVEALLERKGPDAIWGALRRYTLQKSAVDRAIEGGSEPGWRDPERLAFALRALGQVDIQRAQRVTYRDLMWLLGRDMPATGGPPDFLGFELDGRHERYAHWNRVIVALLPPGEAEELVQATAVRAMGAAGVGPDDAWKLLWPLVAGTLANLQSGPGPGTLTGPVARGDAATIQRNLGALRGDEGATAAYVALSREALALAADGGVPPDRIAAIREILACTSGGDD